VCSVVAVAIHLKLGKSIKGWVDEGGRLSPERAAGLAEKVNGGLSPFNMSIETINDLLKAITPPSSESGSAQ
jgi:hypothetical protein